MNCEFVGALPIFPVCPRTDGRVEGGEDKPGHGPDDPALFPVVVPEADSEVHRRHKAPVGPGKPTDAAVRPLFADGVFPRLHPQCLL